MLVILKTKFADSVGVVILLDCVSLASFLSGSVHSFVFGLRVPTHIMLLFLVTDTLVAVNSTVQSSLHNWPMEMSECHARPGNMYPLVRLLTFKVHCVLVDSIHSSGRVTLIFRFFLTVSTCAEG
jgi:hypothetical protein